MCLACLQSAREAAAGEKSAESGPSGDGGGALFAVDTPERGATGPNGKDSLTALEAAAQITRSGLTWSTAGQPTTVTYAYRSTQPATLPDVTAWSRFNAAQIAATELALQSWADVSGVTFQRVNDGDGYSNEATILFNDYGAGSAGSAAFAYLPGSRAASSATGDIWINVALGYNANPVAGAYGQQVLVHEIGHAIGLSHPAAYNAGPTQVITYTGNATYYEDSRQYSVMSYFSETNTGGGFAGRYAAAPLIDDIAAAQRLYGANTTTRAGDTVYGFGSTAGRAQFAAVTETDLLIFAVWDAGGTDTFDFSGYAVGQTIDLREGRFSDVGGLIGNVSIAAGVVVENAFGGGGSDVIVGNAADNMLQGRGGVDALSGLDGNDVLIAGDPALQGAPDVLKGQATANGSLATAVALDGAFDLDFSPIIAGSTTTPHATVRAVGHGAPEYYRVSAAAGAQLTLDIDGAGFDSYVYVYDAAGTLVASNDDAALDPGSGSPLDSRLTYVAVTAGVYYVAVNIYDAAGVGNGPPAGSAYTLHVSLSSATVAPSVLRGSSLEGGNGADVLLGGSGPDRLNGGPGDDLVLGEGGDDLAFGGFGADILNGGAGADLLNGEAGDDVLSGGAGADLLSGELGADRLFGGADADVLIGGEDADTLNGESGDDALFGGAGADVLAGEDGADQLFGSLDGDALLGGAGADSLNGEQGDDALFGGDGGDLMSGEDGDDALFGGAGRDVLIGGAGRDRFVFQAADDAPAAEGGDLIVDFTAGVDLIDLAGIDADTLSAGDQAFVFVAAFTGAAGQATLSFDAGTGRTLFRADVNGDGVADVGFALIGQVGPADGWVL